MATVEGLGRMQRSARLWAIALAPAMGFTVGAFTRDSGYLLAEVGGMLLALGLGISLMLDVRANARPAGAA